MKREGGKEQRKEGRKESKGRRIGSKEGRREGKKEEGNERKKWSIPVHILTFVSLPFLTIKIKSSALHFLPMVLLQQK